MPICTRRHVLRGAAATGATLAGSLPGFLPARAAQPELPAALPQGLRASAVLDALPGKKALIKLAYRPPNYETPIEYFREAITHNDAFFVRYHLAVIPRIDAETRFRLVVMAPTARQT
jgi:sulfite dehydrogenase (cytochrome) subunit A